MAGVAILGFGVVGSGVAEVLTRNGAQIDQRLHSNLCLKYILTRRDYPNDPFRDRMVRDFSIIEKDPEVKVVVEVIGGITAAKEYTLRAMRAGKSVVTANKELVSTFGYELMMLAKECGVRYLYEASVGGGIPIIRPLKQCLAANAFSEIRGILNGTTNYILTSMRREGLSFEDALRLAQAHGYAEADPTADVEGMDACRKICILASLAFGNQISPDDLSTEGITAVTKEDLLLAERAGYRIKLLGRAVRTEEGALYVYVAPHLLPVSDPLAGVEGVFNAISVRGNAIGNVMFYGQGAGKLPTASAVVADVMEAVGKGGEPQYPDWGPRDERMCPTEDGTACRWYVRVEEPGEALERAVSGVVLLREDGQTPCGSAGLTPPVTADVCRKMLSSLTVRAAFRVMED